MSNGRVPGSSSGCSGGCFGAEQVKIQYLSGYFTAHMLPLTSYRYVYLLWFVTIAVCLVLGATHMLKIGDSSYIGAVWKRWATKNRVYKVGKRTDIHGNLVAKTNSNPQDANTYPPTDVSRLRNAPLKRRRVYTFPSFGRMILLFFMLAVPICLTLIGADFIGPNVGVFDFSESWPAQIPPNSIGLARRLQKRVQWGIGDYSVVTTVPPTRTLPYRTWWTSGDRTGDMTSALTSIVIVMALKQVPFALLSTRFFGGYAFDRLSFLHKWGGRIIWLFATTHLVTWVIQLNKDQRLGSPVWSFVFLWVKFRWGWVSYGFLTAMVALSIGPIRNRYYELFYIGHIVTVIGFMVTGIFHHPPLAQWLYIPLAWWGADRVSRLVKVAWVNGIGFAGRKPQFAVTTKPAQSMSTHSSQEKDLHGMGHYPESSRGHGTQVGSVSSHKHSFPSSHGSAYEHTLVSEGHSAYPGPAKRDFYSEHYGIASSREGDPASMSLNQATGSVERRATKMSLRYDPVSDLILDYAQDGSDHDSRGLDHERTSDEEPIKYTLEDTGSFEPSTSDTLMSRNSGYRQSMPNVSGPPNPRRVTMGPSQSGSTITYQPRLRPSQPRPAMPADVAALIRPGYAFAQILPGKTLRLTLRTPNKMSWKPGQWVYLNIPGVRWFESHPFTIASAHDAEFPSSTQFADADEEKGLIKQEKAKGEERTMVLLIRARKGFTRHLWDHVVKARQDQIETATESVPGASFGGFEGPQTVIGKGTTGVHIRALVDGPYGSAKRTHWNIHSTVVIVCGGSGVSYGMAALEHLCACIIGAQRLGKDGKGGKRFQTQRVRFVWIMREFAHLQWVASALRRCIEMVPPDQLKVDLFVTHYNDQSAVQLRPETYYPGHEFAPPSAPFGSTATGRDSFVSVNTPTDNMPRAARFTEGPEQEELDLTANDLTHFEGEDESAPTANELEMSKRIRSEGKLRRAATRKKTMKKKGGRRVEAAEEDIHSQLAIHQGAPRRFRGQGHDLADHLSADEGDSRDDQPCRPRPGPQPLNGPDGLLMPPGALGGGSISPTPGTPSLGPFSTPDPSLPGTPRLPRDVPLGGMSRPSFPPTPSGEWDRHSGSFTPRSRHSTVNLLADGPGAMAVDNVPIDLDEEEDNDLRVVAELARPGHPKLDRIIREEVERSAGRTLVASCGPTSLGAVLKSIASKHINPARVRAGDLRGHVNLTTESFDWGG